MLNRGREGSAGYGGERRRWLNRGRGRERSIRWREEESVTKGEGKGALAMVERKGEC